MNYVFHNQIGSSNICKIFLCLISALFSGQIAAAPITWMVESAPPFFATEGPSAGKGPGDLMLKQIFALLPDDSHHIVNAETARILHEMEKNDGICDLVLQRSQARQSMVAFTRRPLIVPAFRVLIQKDRLQAFQPLRDRDGKVLLDRLAETPSLRGGYVLAQLNPAPIDEFVTSPSRKVGLEAVASAKLGYTMLARRRLDFFFSIGIEGEETIDGESQSSIMALPIAQLPKTVEMFVGCSKGPVGRRIVARLDSLLADQQTWADFVAPLKGWLDPEDFALALSASPHQE